MSVEILLEPGTAFRVKGEEHRIDIVVETVEIDGKYGFEAGKLNYDDQGNPYLSRFGSGGIENIEEIVEEEKMSKEELFEAIKRGWIVRTEGQAPFEGEVEEIALKMINTPFIKINS